MGLSLGKITSGLLGGGSSSSSSSSTSTAYNDTSSTVENVTDFGAAAKDNISLGANSNFAYTEQGIVGENLNNLLGTVSTLNSTSQSTLSNVLNSTINSVQNSAETAIKETAKAYADSDNELRNVIDGVRPIALYAALAAAAYFIFRR